MNQPKPLQIYEPGLEKYILKGLINDQALENVLLSEIELSSAQAERVKVDASLITKSNFASSLCKKIQLTDVRLLDTDLSNCQWPNASLVHSEFIHCRLTGAQFNDSYIQDVTFKECLIDLGQFRFSTLKKVIFDSCILREADFQNAQLKQVTFTKCDLSGARLISTKMAGVDIRSSTFTHLEAHLFDLYGTIMTHEQLIAIAHDMAASLGITVKDKND